MFAALIGGMTHALTSRTVIRVPPHAFRVGQALIGVTIGSLVSVSALTDMGTALLPILVVTLGHRRWSAWSPVGCLAIQ